MLTLGRLRPPPRRLRGFTLIELLLALAISGVLLGTVVGLGVKEQRMYAGLGRRLQAAEQLRHAGAIVPIDLRPLSPRSGDIIAGEARDSSLELRETIAAAVVCTASGASLALPPSDSPLGADLVSMLTAPEPGDSMWLLADSGAVDAWDAVRVLDISNSADRCPYGIAPDIAPYGAPAQRHSGLVIDTDDSNLQRYPPGTPVRFTRRVRYSVYRSSDGDWYLGFRDWNAATGRFNTVQPVSGPFERPTSARPVFRYFDARSAELPVSSLNPAAVALVQITLRAPGTSIFGNAPSPSLAPRIDSSDAFIAVRNRW